MLSLKISRKLNANGSRLVQNGSKVTGEFYRADGEAVAS